MSTNYIPVKVEEWAKMVEAIKVAAELLSENKRLKDKLARMTKAGDQMSNWITSEGHDLLCLDDWHEAKETPPQ